MTGLEPAEPLAEGLREAARRLASAEPTDEAILRLRKRMHAIADGAKQGSPSASRRLRRLLSDLDRQGL